jgi:4a-hydroxytetrahydrobiopterin dehydratase
MRKLQVETIVASRFKTIGGPMQDSTNAPGAELAAKSCVPCRGDVPPLQRQQISNLRVGIPDWDVIEDHHLSRTYTFKGFGPGLVFVNEVGAIAESEGHHPDIYLAWGKVEIKIWTHKIDGLSESDFILAAKCDQLFAT